MEETTPQYSVRIDQSSKKLNEESQINSDREDVD